MAKVIFSKLSKSRRERIKRREARLTDPTTSKLKPIASSNSLVSLFKPGTLKSYGSLEAISSSSSLYSSKFLSSLVASLSWKSLAPSANESGGRDQPIQVIASVSAPGSPVKQRMPIVSCETADPHALFTLSELRVLHTKVLQGLTNRTNALARRQAKRKSTRRKEMTPSTSVASLDFSSDAKAELVSSTPLSKEGSWSIAADSDTTLVSTEAPTGFEQEAKELVLEKANISTIPKMSSKYSVDITRALTYKDLPSPMEKACDRLDMLSQPKDKMASKQITPESVLSENLFFLACEVQAGTDAHTTSGLSPRPVHLPLISVEGGITEQEPFSSPVSHLNGLASQPPTLSGSQSGSDDSKENIPPPPPNAPAGINVKPLSKAKKPARYRDKLPKSVLGDSVAQSYSDTIRNVIDRAREANRLTSSEKGFGLGTTSDSTQRPPQAVDDYYPSAPGGWKRHQGALEDAPYVQDYVLRNTRTDVNLEQQIAFQDEDINEPSLFSTLNPVSYIVDLVVSPLKFVWRLTYGG